MSEPDTVKNLTKPRNLGGRPLGSRSKKTLLVEQMFRNDAKDVESIVAKVIAMAKDGDLAAMRLILERISPARRGALNTFPLPDVQTPADVVAALGGLLAAVAQGLLSTAEASELAGVIEKLGAALEQSEMDKRLTKLEAQVNR